MGWGVEGIATVLQITFQPKVHSDLLITGIKLNHKEKIIVTINIERTYHRIINNNNYLIK